VRASAKVDRYAHQVTAGKGLAARWLTIEVTAIARKDSTDAWGNRLGRQVHGGTPGSQYQPAMRHVRA
jgi:hypothetical protein